MKQHNDNRQIIRTINIFFTLQLCILNGVFAQDWATPWVVNQQRIDIRDLGNPDVNEIPEYNSAITSLITARDGIIYGGTTGEEAYLFFFNPITNKVRHLGKIPGQESIHHAVAEDSLSHIYIGTGKNMFDKLELSPGGYWNQTDETLWKDIKARFQDYPGGHLYRYNPAESNRNVKLPDMDAEVEDLGIPVANNSIYALTASPDGSVIYGLTYPDAHFFIYNISEGNFNDLGTIDERIVFHGPERHWRSVCRDLICDKEGNVYFSGTGGEIKYYSPESESIQSTGIKIPGDYFPAQFYSDYDVVEYFDSDRSGLIYGGTADGYLFSFDPCSKELKNLGKPRAHRRIRCLQVGDDGKIYLIAGERPETTSVPCKLFEYDPSAPGFTDHGMIIVDRSPYYYRRGYQFDCMTKGRDGTIYLGESEYRSNLFVLIPPF